MLDAQGNTYADLAEVLALAGKPAAAEALEQALDRFERKGNLVSAERTRARLAVMGARRPGSSGTSGRRAPASGARPPGRP